MKYLLTLSWAGICLVMFAATPVHAQKTATSFDQLRVIVDVGDKVTVTDAAGSPTRGKIKNLSASTLELDVDGVPRSFAQSDVNTIQRSGHASIERGAKWGLMIGLGFAALGAIAIAADDEWDSTYDGSKAGTITGGFIGLAALGTGIGVAASRLIPKQHLVYAGRGARQEAVKLSPVLTGARRGVALSLSF